MIPLIERLYTEKWSVDDGLAAIVITPTRELALQVYYTDYVTMYFLVLIPSMRWRYRTTWLCLTAVAIKSNRIQYYDIMNQIFEVVRVVGKLHQLSAGLVTGGRKEFEGEQDRIVKMNILVATPGRLLQVCALKCSLKNSYL